MRRSEGKHLLVAVASLEPLAKRQTLLNLMAEVRERCWSVQ
jgi:hypothetical protein